MKAHPELVGVSIGFGGGRLQFEDVSRDWGVAIDARYDACVFADIDNDGRLDFYVNGTVTGGTSYRDYLFRNAGGRFDDVTPENIAGHPGRSRRRLGGRRCGWRPGSRAHGLPPDGMHLGDAESPPAARHRAIDQRPRAGRAAAARRAQARRCASLRQVPENWWVRDSSIPDLATTRRTTARARRLCRHRVAVDVEVTFPAGGKRTSALVRDAMPGGSIAVSVK